MIWNEKWISFLNDAPENISLYTIVQSVGTGIRGSLSCNCSVCFFPLLLYDSLPNGKPCVALHFFDRIPPNCGSQLSQCHHIVTLWKFSSWPHSKVANERCPLFTLRFYELGTIPWIWQILNKCLMQGRQGRAAYQMILIFHFAQALPPLVFLLITLALWTAKIYSFRWRFIVKILVHYHKNLES